MKKILSIALTVCILVFSIIPYCVYAEEGTESSLSVNSVIGNSGETVELSLNIHNNPGIIGILAEIEFDNSILELMNVENGDIFARSTAIFGRDYSEQPYKMSWEDGLSQSDNCNDGSLAVLTFKIKDNAVFKKTEIRVNYDANSTFNSNLENVSFISENGAVYSSALTARSGSTTIISENRYITGLRCGLTENQMNNLFINSNGNTTKYSKAGDFQYLGTSSRLTLTYYEDLKEDYILVIFGDVDGDGWCDGMDSMIVNCLINGMLTREQVGEAAYMAADCNHDDVIDEADAALLEQTGVILESVDQNKSPRS